MHARTTHTEYSVFFLLVKKIFFNKGKIILLVSKGFDVWGAELGAALRCTDAGPRRETRVAGTAPQADRRPHLHKGACRLFAGC